jgi:hypothetical protein
MNINKYRDLCRNLIRQTKHKLLTPARKDVLLVLVERINDKEGYTAWPSFDTLADTSGWDRQTVIKAVNAGRKVGVVERTTRGGIYKRGGVSNRYRFPIDPVSGEILGRRADLVSHETATPYPATPRPSIQRDTQSSYLSPYLSSYAPTSSSGLGGHSAAVASEDPNIKERESGERALEGPGSEPRLRWTRPIVYGERARTTKTTMSSRKSTSPGLFRGAGMSRAELSRWLGDRTESRGPPDGE